MIISLPDKYNIDNSKKNILSIRLNPDGLSFSLYNTSGKDNFFYREVLFDHSLPYITSLKEFFFENSFLTWPFSKIYILAISNVYTLIPTRLFTEKSQENYISYNFDIKSGQVLCNQLSNPDAILSFLIDEEVYEFCSRSFIHPEYIHHLKPLIELWSKQSLPHPENRMYVYINPGFIDIICLRQGELLMINSFIYNHINDILYYILYIWQQKEMNQLTDILQLTGNTTSCQEITHLLQMYINNVQATEIPSEAYLKGEDIVKAPLDLISLIL